MSILYRNSRFVLICLFSLAVLGCSSIPSPIEPVVEAKPTQNHAGWRGTGLWGLFEVTVDLENHNLQITQLRNSDNTLNVLSFLEPPKHAFVTYDSGTLIIEPTQNYVGVDVILTNPFVTPKNRFMGFDVRGLVIGPDVLNADGCTPLMNPADFEGEPYGYVDGLLGTPNSAAGYDGPYWGYKYFADGLGLNDNMGEFFSQPVNLAARGVFNEGSINMRHYDLTWKGSGYGFLIFNYAVIANYHIPTGPPPFEPDDFPISGANMPEAFCLSVSSFNSSLYFNDDGYGGGLVDLELEVWDWQNLSSTEVILQSVPIGPPPGEIWLGPVTLDTYEPGGTSHSGIYRFTDVGGTPPASGELELLITVSDNSITYGASWFQGLLSLDNPFYFVPVYTCLKLKVQIHEVVMDWVPVEGQTGVQLSKTPAQGSRPPEFTVFSDDPGMSRGTTLMQWANYFFEWENDYSDYTDDFPWLHGDSFFDFNHFEMVLDGRHLAITSYSQEPVPPFTSPRSGLIGLIAEESGNLEPMNGFIKLTAFGYYADAGDISSAVVGYDGTEFGQDENLYFTYAYSSMPGNLKPDDGAIFFARWLWPYDIFIDPDPLYRMAAYGLSARDPVNPGPINDFEPRDQRIGVDDNTGIYLVGQNPPHPDYDWAEFFYILDDLDMLHMVIVEWEYPSEVIYAAGVEASTWGGTPVDVEVAPAFTYTAWSPWGWSEVLIDKGNGTWTVMTLLWDFTQEPPIVFVLDETEPLPGTPFALDVDNTDFEVHVIAGVDDKVEATVFEWYDSITGGDG